MLALAPVRFVWLGLPLVVAGQTLHLEDDIRTYGGLTNTVVTLSGRAGLQLTGSGDPMPGCVIELNAPDAWLLLSGVAPSQVASSLLGRVRVNGAPAVRDGNARVVQYAQGALILPHGPDFAPLEVFDGRYFTGPSKRLGCYTAWNSARLGTMAAAISSFKLKRGYLATFAQQENGTGASRCYVAQDGDLAVGRLPAALENNVRFVRVFPWRWVSKKGIAGDIEANLNVAWLYNWNLSRNSPLDWEYVPIRQNRWWPSLDQDWKARGATHLLGYNEPDRPDQANLSVSDALAAWPDLLATGLRVGAPAVSDGGRSSWLYPFIQQADAAGLRVDFVPVHYYWCYNPADPAGAANQMYNFLKATYDQVRRPLWVTEWNNGANWTGCADPTFEQQAAAVQAMIDMLESTPFVERYAIFNWVEDVRRVKWDDGTLTPAGQRYRDKVSTLAYRQELADAGAGAAARYSLDGDAHDGSGNGNDAMVVGAPRFVPGRFGQAVALNGSTDYLQLPPSLATSTDWAFAGWVLWNGGGHWQRVFDFGLDTSRFMFLTPRSSAGTLRFGIQNGGSQQRLEAPALPVGVWTHLAVSLSGDTGKLYVNGVPVATNTALTINPADLGARFCYLGKSQWPADPLFNGRFDDFRFFDSALSDAQVAAIYSTPPPQFIASVLTGPDAVAGQPYIWHLAELVGGGVAAVTFSKIDGPAWLSVALNGRVGGIPGPAHGGLNRWLVRLTDTHGSFHTALLHVNVSGLTLSLGSSADDAEESAAGSVNLTSTDLELVNDPGTGAGDQTVGLRFTDVPLPPGAIIREAYIQFTADESQTARTILEITAEAADDAAPFTTAARNLSSRTRTTLRVPWEPPAWTAGQSNLAQRTPNLAGLVQEVVSRPGWVSGNALVFLITGTGHRTADSFDKSGGAPARLSITYASATPRSTARATITGSANDAEQSAAGAVSLTSTDLELVNDAATGAGNQMVGLRFENLLLPSWAVIAEARLQFTADEAQSEPTTLTFRAEASDHAAPFTTNAYNLSSRPLTTAAVIWQPAAWTNVGESGPLQLSPDLAPLIREVIARPGWRPGNALAILISGTGHRTADAFDKVGGSPPVLTVRYGPELPRGTYARWADGQPERESPGADPDGDGYDNLLEYALGRDPLRADLMATPLTMDDTQLALTHTRPAEVLDVSYAVEWSDTLQPAAWSAAGVIQRIVADDGTTRVIQATLPRGHTPQRFVRLKVVRF